MMSDHLLSYHTFEEDGVVLFLSIDLVTPLKRLPSLHTSEVLHCSFPLFLWYFCKRLLTLRASEALHCSFTLFRWPRTRCSTLSALGVLCRLPNHMLPSPWSNHNDGSCSGTSPIRDQQSKRINTIFLL